MFFIVTNHTLGFVTIHRVKKNGILLSLLLSNKKFPKSKKGNGFWTFINVQKRKPEKSFENDPFFHFCTIMVTIIFSGCQIL